MDPLVMCVIENRVKYSKVNEFVYIFGNNTMCIFTCLVEWFVSNTSIVVNIIDLVDGIVLDLMSCGALSILAYRGFTNSMSL